jgi:hypothetical protein
VTLWPKVSQDVPDTKDLKLAILSPEHSKQSGTTSAFVDELLKKCGATFRTYQNTLLVLAPDEGEFASLRQKVKRFLALRAICDDKALMRQLSEENRKTLESKVKEVEGGIPFSLLSAYRHLAKPGESGMEWLDLGTPTIGERGSLAKRVREYLKNRNFYWSASRRTTSSRKRCGRTSKKSRWLRLSRLFFAIRSCRWLRVLLSSSMR